MNAQYCEFPKIDPVAIALGPLKIHWYGLAYLAGIVLGYLWCRHLIRQKCFTFSEVALLDFMPWAALGVVAGGRLGHVIFYGLEHYFMHPLEIFMIWKPGMSFHGGVIGVITAVISYSQFHQFNLYRFSDMITACIPIGLFFGRLANYINGELYGRVTNVPWAIIFPHAGPWPRHPSQLYEALGEGILLWVFVNFCFNYNAIKNSHPGQMAGRFLFGYAIARIAVECFRVPEVDLGGLSSYVTYGQLLSLPMLIYGLYLYFRPHNQK